MKLTTKSEYSLLLLLALARRDKAAHVDLKALCLETKTPNKYAEQLFSILKKNKILKSRRGAGGGYAFYRQPEEITLAEIVRLMDGPLAATEAASIHFHTSTPIEKEKKLLGVFQEIRDYVSAKMESITLADIV